MMLKSLIAVIVLYGGFVALLYVGQRSLQYFPERQTHGPGDDWPAGGRRGGARHHRWRARNRLARSAARGTPFFLYFHGNGGSLRWRDERFRALIADGSGLVALSYRGYGGSSGRPTETGLIEDATAAYAFAIARYSAERIVLWGESLGSALAITLAAEKPVGCLVLEAPFTSAVDVGVQHYWFVPVRLLMKDQFRSDRRISKVTAPVLIVHGENDAVVPIILGERLFGLIQASKRFVRVAGAGHNDLGADAVAAAKRFIAEQLRPSSS